MDPNVPMREEAFILFNSASPSWIPHWVIYYWPMWPSRQNDTPIVASAVNIFGFETSEYDEDLKEYMRWQPLQVFNNSELLGWPRKWVFGLAALSIGLFLVRIFSARYRREPFLSWTLMLTGVPFAVGAWRAYDLLQYTWLAMRLYSTQHIALQAGYHYQLGVIVSLTMLALYVVAWKIRQRSARLPTGSAPGQCEAENNDCGIPTRSS